MLKRSPTNARLLQAVDKDKRVVLEFSDVCTHVPVIPIAGLEPAAPAASDQGKKGPPPTEKQVLKNVSGVVEPGEVRLSGCVGLRAEVGAMQACLLERAASAPHTHGIGTTLYSRRCSTSNPGLVA